MEDLVGTLAHEFMIIKKNVFKSEFKPYKLKHSRKMVETKERIRTSQRIKL
jgi:hypothetical protein